MAKKRKLSADGVSRETLEDTPGRVTKFLVGLATRPTARTLMAARGLDLAEQKHGWSLLMNVGSQNISEVVTDDEVESAVAELDNWDEPGVRHVAVGLHRHPEARDMVLKGIEPKVGPEAVTNVALILERLERLESSEDGRAALATLAKRGIDATERKRLAALVKTATAASKPIAPSTNETEEAYIQALLELREWYLEWAEMARLTIKRRDHLIRLGLAERRTGGADTDVEDVTDPTDEEDVDDVEDPTPFIDPNKPKP